MLPRELVLTDAQAEAEAHQRDWARSLAEKFFPGRPPASASNRRPPPLRPAVSSATDLAELEARIERLSCASAFRYRPRPTWLYLVGFGVTTLPLAFVLLQVLPQGLAALGWLAGGNALLWFRLWRGAVPVCPNCKQNVRTCPAQYCPGCGNPLSHNRCVDCGVDESWIGWLRPSTNGRYQRISYCPGCGVELDSGISRWRAGERL